MKTLLKSIAALSFLVLFCGCESNSSSGSPTLTNQELLELMGEDAFEVVVPDNIKPEQFAGLALKFSDGRIDTFGSSNQWVPGEKVKIVCFRPEGTTFRYAYFRESGSGDGSTANFPETKQRAANPKRRNLAEGDQLMRFSVDNSIRVVPTNNPDGDDFDVIFHVGR